MPKIGFRLGDYSNYNPFTFDEKLKPLLMYGLAYALQENEAANLKALSKLIEGKLDPSMDTNTYNKYLNYARDLDALANEIMTNGINNNTRRGVLDLKARFASDIVPIADAIAKRDKWADLQREMMIKDPTHFIGKYAGNLSIDDIMAKPNMNIFDQHYSGAMILELASNAAKNFKDSFGHMTWEEFLKTNYFLTHLLSGWDRESFENFKKGITDSNTPYMQMISELVLGASGINNWTDLTDKEKQQVLDRVDNHIKLGLWSGLGTHKDELHFDEWAALLEKGRLASAKSGKTPPSNLAVDSHSYFDESAMDFLSDLKELEKSLTLVRDENGNLTLNYNKFYKMDDQGNIIGVKNANDKAAEVIEQRNQIKLYDIDLRKLEDNVKKLKKNIVSLSPTTRHSYGQAYDILYNNANPTLKPAFEGMMSRDENFRKAMEEIAKNTNEYNSLKIKRDALHKNTSYFSLTPKDAITEKDKEILGKYGMEHILNPSKDANGNYVKPTWNTNDLVQQHTVYDVNQTSMNRVEANLKKSMFNGGDLDSKKVDFKLVNTFGKEGGKDLSEDLWNAIKQHKVLGISWDPRHPDKWVIKYNDGNQDFSVYHTGGLGNALDGILKRPLLINGKLVSIQRALELARKNKDYKMINAIGTSIIREFNTISNSAYRTLSNTVSDLDSESLGQYINVIEG